MSTVNNMQIQDDEGNVFHPETSIEQIVGENGTQVFPGGKPGNMESSNMAVAFEEAKTRENIKSGEKHRVLFGKIQKFFTDLKAVAFSGKYGDLSERPTLGGAAGYKVADNDTTNNSEFLTTARVAYEHGLEIDALSRDLGRVNVYVGGDGKLHFVNSGGADSVLPFNNKPEYYVVSTGRELAVSTYSEKSIKITIPDRDGKTAVGGYITNIRVYNSNGDLQEAPIRCNYANKVLTVISSAGKWSSGWTAYYFDVVGIYI